MQMRMWRGILVMRREFNSSVAAKRSAAAKWIATRRAELPSSRRIVVKLGSAVITRKDECGLALGRLASIVEQISWIHNNGKEVVLVTSGAVALGKQRMQREKFLAQSMRTVLPSTQGQDSQSGETNLRACATAGQTGLMSLYESMFAQYGIKCAQVLLTSRDFTLPDTNCNLLTTVAALLSMKVLPVVNGNDVVAPSPQKNSDLKNVVSMPDNDQLSVQVATGLKADLLILLSDVEGLYTNRPRELKSAVQAVEGGTAVVIADGTKQRDAILDIVKGKPVGTFITLNGRTE